MQKAIHLKFEKSYHIDICQPKFGLYSWMDREKKLLILGFGIFGIVHSRPKIWPFEN